MKFQMALHAALLAAFSFSTWAAEIRLAGHIFTLPDGFEIEQVAGPPLVERPMLAAFDDRGRLYVCDSAGVNARAPELAKNPPDRIRVLEDTNGDGVFDKSTVFADKLVFPQGVLWHDGSVYVSSPPNFLRLQDTDGDGVADKREILASGFPNTGCADDMHGANLGPDGRIYWFSGRFQHEVRDKNGALIHKGTTPVMFRCKPDGSEMEMVSGVLGNAVGVSFNPEGDGFVSGTFMAPDSMGAGLRDGLIHVVEGGEYPVRGRDPNELKKTGELLPPLAHHGASATSDNCIYRSAAFGAEYTGNVFACLFNMRKVMRHVLERDGATFKCRNEDFLVSDNYDFHPTDVLEDADGSLLVLDTGGWFRICCPTSQIAKPEVKGAIYRIRRKGAPSVRDPRGLEVKWASLSAAELVPSLADSRFAVADRAINQLAKLGASSVQALARNLANNNLSTRINAIWALGRIDGDAARAAVRTGLTNGWVSARKAAAIVAGLQRDTKAIPRLTAMVVEDTERNRRESATALGRIRSSEAVPALLESLKNPGDRFLEHALIFALIQVGDRGQVSKGLDAREPSVRRGALIALDQMDGGNLTPNLVVPLLRSTDPILRETAFWITGHRPEWAAEISGFLREELANKNLTEVQRSDLQKQLLTFTKNNSVQELIADTLRDSATPTELRLTLLETMAGTPMTKLPSVWATPLEQSLTNTDDRVVRQGVIAIRSVPLGRRPSLRRIDAQLNFPESTGSFAGTQLSEKFAARWSGVIRLSISGSYIFSLESNGGSKLAIDGRQVVDNRSMRTMSEKSGEMKLDAGDHKIQLDYFQNTGGTGCVLSWRRDSQKETIPATALFHGSPKQGGALTPGLSAEYFEIGRDMSDFPDLQYFNFTPALLALARDVSKPEELRMQALAGISDALEELDFGLFEFLSANLAPSKPPLFRVTSASVLGRAKLTLPQRHQMVGAILQAGPLELPKLLSAYAESNDEELGRKIVDALKQSKSLDSLKASQLKDCLAKFPSSIQHDLEPLLRELAADAEKQKARLAELEPALRSGDRFRGSHIFNSAKAACTTCHRIGYLGGEVGPNLGRIGAIRSENDLLEAIVFPSASFARGYETMMVKIQNGEEYSGVIARETPENISLVTGPNSEMRLARSEIKDIRLGTVSLMPQGLDQQLSREELADLIAFLKSLK